MELLQAFYLCDFDCVMTKILLLSDTHNHLDDRILDYAGQADEVWHAGDIGSLAVTDALGEVKDRSVGFTGILTVLKYGGNFP